MPVTLEPVVHSHASSWHDGGVALLTGDGEVVALAGERVGDRYKHSWDSSLAYDHLRGLERYRSEFGGPRDQFLPVSDRLVPDDHHRFHAASTFFGSGLERSAILVVDGQGTMGEDLVPTTIWRGQDTTLELVEALHRTPEEFADNSLGHFYTAVGALAGMQALHQEGKTMALAAYGEPSPFLGWLRDRCAPGDDGTYEIDSDFVRAVLGHTLGPEFHGWPPPEAYLRDVWEEAVDLRGDPLRCRYGSCGVLYPDVAYAGQMLLEEMLLGLARRARELTGENSLCLAGGVALNCVANGRITRELGFDEVFVVPAPGDDGQALGKLFLEIADSEVDVGTALGNAYLGPDYGQSEFDAAVADAGAGVEVVDLPESELLITTARLIADGGVVGLCHGRSEVGPRALGHRSIVADPRTAATRERLNLHVKGREWYRPVAPMVQEDRVSEYFESERPTPFMTKAVRVREDRRAEIPAACHVDGTARVQTISAEQDRRCYELVGAFEQLSGVPVLINTSFNGQGEPMVETPRDAVRAFEAMDLDALLIGGCLLVKRGRWGSDREAAASS